MTLMLELTPEQEEALRSQATAWGLAPDDYLKRLAGLDAAPAHGGSSEGEASEVIPPGQSLAEALAGRIGRVHSGGRYKYSAKDSGKAFAEMMVEKKKQGRL